MLENININKLFQELLDAGYIDVGINKRLNKIYANKDEEIQDTSEIQALLQVHDPTDYVEARQQASEDNAKNIPGWATWSEAEMLAKIDNDVVDLASTKKALKAMARMLIALRNKNFPNLRGQQED